MNCSPFSCPIFLGHPEARGRCSQGKRVLYGRDLCCSGGTEKAEAAKLPGAGIGPKPCPGKCAKEKVYILDSVRGRKRTRPTKAMTAEKTSRVRALIQYKANICGIARHCIPRQRVV